jgi:uncharacterized protein (DUF1778 family)
MALGRGKETQESGRKRERLECWVSSSAKQTIQYATAVTGLTAGDLAYEGARRILDELACMVLTGADREVFLDALRNPPRPTAKPIAALKRHRDVA